ncbi:hypothetical protein CMQ_1485 [Grosmannia clavigera kw1407]|uniref:RNA ligase/cyclic nucleotide phosphodiesterase n=1 Tax=Grosmannia clavigera (strain kw1407 / UAMH 11150) TaxID=655863 RepID=F0XDN8_GROCL|nr:uncharacterized protein CMQ_1485 [Grosmannia clavigera kw1407]EFX04557.1 hypothetical protein CMQ_1485 [Grosmannia clavigera kw1407]
MVPPLESTDVRNNYEDLSGAEIRPDDNPYESLIAASNDDPPLQTQMQARYAVHRTTRNAQQRAKFLASDFQEVLVDPFLLRIENPSIEPAFEDPRHCVVFWARPPEHILRLADRVQQMLKKAAPNLWLMPLYRMHMTALEICHSRTPAEVDVVRRTMASARTAESDENGIAALVNYPYRHRARLVRPMISYDLAAIALSFVPAAGEPSASPPPVAPGVTPLSGVGSSSSSSSSPDAYTYHHLRRDLFTRARDSGVDVASRYVVPSAHITLARFLCQDDHATLAARHAWIDALDAINVWLERVVWPATWQPTASTHPPSPPPPPQDRLVGEWIVGQEKGLDARVGPLWYGQGRTVMLGEGF